MQQLYKQYTKSNGNSIEFFLLTQTQSVIKLFQTKSLYLVAQSRHHSYPIQPRDLYILRGRKSITIAIVITIYILVTVTQKAMCSYPILRRATACSHYQSTTADEYIVTSARRKQSGDRKAFFIQRKDRGSEHIHQCSLIIFKYKNNKRTRNNKDGLGAVLCAGESSKSIEEQLVG